MANEDRIRAWRTQRQAGLIPTDPQANALASAFARAAAIVVEHHVDIRALIKLVLVGLSAFPDADRRELYSRIYDGAKAGVEANNLPAETADYWGRRFRAVTRQLEMDIREGVDVLAPNYLPKNLAQFDAKLGAAHKARLRRAQIERARVERRRATHEDVAHDIPVPPDEAVDLARLRPLLDYLHASQRTTVGGTVPRGLTVGPLFLLRFLLIQSESRIALLWVFVGPLMIMTIWSAMYIINGLTFVLGMDVATFTMTGVVMWVMFRMVVFRTSEAYAHPRGWLNLHAVSPFIFAVGTGVVYMLVYIFVMATMVTIGSLAGLVSLPNNILGVLGCIFGIATMAICTGILFGGIASRWEYFLRFAAAIERFLQLFSSVFFVSEQLPASFRKYILWCPLAHGFQILRSCYFSAYKSQDASLTYFLIAIIMFMLMSFIVDRISRPNLQPT